MTILDGIEDAVKKINDKAIKLDTIFNESSTSNNDQEIKSLLQSIKKQNQDILTVLDDINKKIIATKPCDQIFVANKQIDNPIGDNINATTPSKDISNFSNKRRSPNSTLYKRRKEISDKHSSEIENFNLAMKEAPESVSEVYYEYENKLKKQVQDFEKKYGKGQLSRISKIRTLQRRGALTSEINKYALSQNITTEQAIAFFQNIIVEKNKSVPWLYSNLAKVLNEYEI
ncbi:uncharacterized protein SCDLUD_004833 [Saccharomycodes ludwigii]|uniref:uncharacterized protein n=1 Tax=Saccharomycodes ludwigii TaxID=36035 RepID=UPI001E8BBB7C|nr:hypothetical protein SCDLUD_004833 [Saccharomycodes ludwigii]KAH3899390.1 hypothetical protein SCDLUD_004833 [Saccharomycodes ludwigii]